MLLTRRCENTDSPLVRNKVIKDSLIGIFSAVESYGRARRVNTDWPLAFCSFAASTQHIIWYTQGGTGPTWWGNRYRRKILNKAASVGLAQVRLCGSRLSSWMPPNSFLFYRFAQARVFSKERNDQRNWTNASRAVARIWLAARPLCVRCFAV